MIELVSRTRREVGIDLAVSVERFSDGDSLIFVCQNGQCVAFFADDLEEIVRLVGQEDQA